MSEPVTNPVVGHDALPRLEAAPLTPVAPAYADYAAVAALLFWAPLAVAVAVVPMGVGGGLWRSAVGLGVLLVGLAAAGLARREARRRAYAVRQADLIYTSGLLVQRTTVLPIARIQHVETVSGPLERWYGVMRLIGYTAGGARADLVMAGLPPETGERVRAYILQRIGEPVDETGSAAGADG